ncbi:MAG: hypothetical protein VW333_07810, partial [Pseudomonadales bacterium]
TIYSSKPLHFNAFGFGRCLDVHALSLGAPPQPQAQNHKPNEAHLPVAQTNSRQVLTQQALSGSTRAYNDLLKIPLQGGLN